MIPPATLRAIAAAKLDDARVLLANGRHDGAAYICGYAVELSLKARICDTLGWSGFPESNKEFEGLSSFKVHKLDTLLRLSGLENMIKDKSQTNRFADWSIVNQWEPENRYKPIGSISANDAREFLQATENLLRLL